MKPASGGLFCFLTFATRLGGMRRELAAVSPETEHAASPLPPPASIEAVPMRHACEVVADEISRSGHRVLRVCVYRSVHGSERIWPAIGVECLGEEPRYDLVDDTLLESDALLREWASTHWQHAEVCR